MTAPSDPASRLSPPLRTAWEALLSLEADGKRGPKQIRALLETAGIPSRTEAEGLLPASELTDEQRALMELLAQRSWGWGKHFGVPEHSRLLSRWLGQESPRLLEREVFFKRDGVARREPLWRALHLMGPEHLREILASLNPDLGARLEFFLDCHLHAYELGEDDLGVRLRDLEWGSPEDLGPEQESWALEAIAKLAAVEGRKIPMSIRWPVFLVLARAGVECEPEWDALLPLGLDEVEVVLTLECMEAIPEERQQAAICLAVESLAFSHKIVRAGLRLLEEFPSLPLLELVLSRVGEASRAPRRKRISSEDLEDYLDSLAEEYPQLAERIARFRAGEEELEVPLLEVFANRHPSRIEELSRKEQDQLVAAGQGFDGEDRSATERLADDESEHSFLGSLRLLKIIDAEGSPAYDAWLYGVENGTIFEASSTRAVGSLVQGKVECEDPGLARALQALVDETTTGV